MLCVSERCFEWRRSNELATIHSTFTAGVEQSLSASTADEKQGRRFLQTTCDRPEWSESSRRVARRSRWHRRPDTAQTAKSFVGEILLRNCQIPLSTFAVPLHHSASSRLQLAVEGPQPEGHQLVVADNPHCSPVHVCPNQAGFVFSD